MRARLLIGTFTIPQPDLSLVILLRPQKRKSRWVVVFVLWWRATRDGATICLLTSHCSPPTRPAPDISAYRNPSLRNLTAVDKFGVCFLGNASRTDYRGRQLAARYSFSNSSGSFATLAAIWRERLTAAGTAPAQVSTQAARQSRSGAAAFICAATCRHVSRSRHSAVAYVGERGQGHDGRDFQRPGWPFPVRMGQGRLSRNNTAPNGSPAQ
jgi:hypothetical protein